MSFLFGKDITYSFYPLQDNENLSSADLAAIVFVNAYVFAETNGRPSRGNAQDGTGALGLAISSWVANANSGFDFEIPAIEDPDPESERDRYVYWIAINFRLKADAQIQTVVRSLELHRVVGHHKRVAVALPDITAEWPTATSYATPSQIAGYIASSIAKIKEELRSGGYEWAQLYRPDRLNRACVYRAIMAICLSQEKSKDDRFMVRYDEYEGSYESVMGGLKIEYDAHRNGEASKVARPGRYSFV